MIKLVGLFRMAPGIGYDAFVRYYEDVHVPLLLSLFPKIRGFTRNYVGTDSFEPGHGVGGTATSVDFDVITELWFDDAADLDAVQRKTADPEIGRLIAADERKFVDSAKARIFTVTEMRSLIPPSARGAITAVKRERAIGKMKRPSSDDSEAVTAA